MFQSAIFSTNALSPVTDALLSLWKCVDFRHQKVNYVEK